MWEHVLPDGTTTWVAQPDTANDASRAPGPRPGSSCTSARPGHRLPVQPDLAEEARARQRDMARHRDAVRRLIGFVIATRTTEQLPDALTTSR